MPWNNLLNNQMVSFTDAQGGGFTLKAGQSNQTSDQCMTKLEALAKYNLVAASMSEYANNELVPKSVWIASNPGAGFPTITGFGRGVGTFHTETGGLLYSLEVLANDKLVIGGSFNSYKGEGYNDAGTQSNIIRLNPDGSRDTSFNQGGDGIKYTGIGAGAVTGTTTLPDGSMYVVGFFTKYNNTTVNGIVKLLANGSIDTSFNPTSATNGIIGFNVANGNVDRPAKLVVVQPNGRLIVAGSFLTYQGQSSSKIIRLNTDGSIDNSFMVGTGFNLNSIRSVILLADGSMIVSGDFTIYNGTPNQVKVVRLSSTGVLLNSFGFVSATTGASPVLSVQDTQDTDNFLLSGSFTTYLPPPPYSGQTISVGYGVKVDKFGQLISGSSAATFSFNSQVIDLISQTDGGIFAIGQFSTYNVNNTAQGLIRLNANGSVDTSFNSGTGLEGGLPTRVVRQSLGANAGKYVIIGGFTSYNNTLAPEIVRINIDGSRDLSVN